MTWCKNPSKKSVNRLHELLIHQDDPEIKEESEIFSLQIQHRPATFSICGLFSLDFRLFVTMTGVVSTYIIALIQIQPPNILGENATIADGI